MQVSYSTSSSSHHHHNRVESSSGSIKRRNRPALHNMSQNMNLCLGGMKRFLSRISPFSCFCCGATSSRRYEGSDGEYSYHTTTTTTTTTTALKFEILGRFNRARAAQLTLPHYVCHTPLFMPVGTQGTIKGLTTNQLEDIGCQIILGNTYHLALRPTSELIDELGGLHKYMNWTRAMLTDSGGFQMVSLLHLADITEEGVTFQSPVDGKPMLLTPEESIQIQNRIGADIIMALDDVVKTTITGPRIEEAMYRTLRWIDRCISAHKRPNEQNLFGIVQGGLDPVLRDICVRGLVDRNLPGYAIGGLAGGEDKDSFWRVVAQCTAALPEDKPRYVMGVGYPLDIVVCSALGADMYDCVYPTRTARFGTALVPEGVLKLKHNAMADDRRPIDPTCTCMVCKRYTRAYIHSLVTKDAMGSQLLSYHNLFYMMRLSSDLHKSIVQGRFPEFVREFLSKMFPKGDVPEWVCNAMEVAGIDITDCCAEFELKDAKIDVSACSVEVPQSWDTGDGRPGFKG